jgi:hypothetical protein
MIFQSFFEMSLWFLLAWLLGQVWAPDSFLVFVFSMVGSGLLLASVLVDL